MVVEGTYHAPLGPLWDSIVVVAERPDQHNTGLGIGHILVRGKRPIPHASGPLLLRGLFHESVGPAGLGHVTEGGSMQSFAAKADMTAPHTMAGLSSDLDKQDIL